MIKKYFYLLACASLIAFPSCSDSDDNNGGGGEATGTISPENSKENLANAAIEVMDMFQPEDQKELFDIAEYFGAQYGDLEFPSFDNGSKAGYATSAKEFFSEIRNFASGDLTALSRAMNSYTYDIKYSLYTGIYEPGAYAWVKTGDSKDIIIRFKDKNNKNVELKVSATGTPYEYTFTDEYEDYWETVREVYNIECPRNVDVKLTCGNETLVDGSAKTNVNIDGHSFSVDADVTAANIRAIASTSGKDSRITETSEVRIDGKSVISTEATVNGSHLCDIEYMQRISDYDDDDEYDASIFDMFKNASAKVDILGKITVEAEGNLSKNLLNAMNDENFDYWDSYEYDSKEEARADCQKACDIINNSFSCVIRFDKDGKAPIVAVPALYEEKWYDYWEYYLGGVIKFADDSTVSIDDYFGRGFDSVSRRYENVINSYRRAWGI